MLGWIADISSFVQDLVYIEVVQVVCTVVYVVLIVYMELWIVYIEVVQVVCTVVARGCRRALL